MPIQVMKIFKESFGDVREHMLEWFRVAFAPIVIYLLGVVIKIGLYMAAGVPLLPHAAVMGQMEGAGETSFLVILANVIYFFGYIIAVLNLYINGFRYGALQEGGDQWWTLNLDGRFLKMFLYSFLIIILSGVYGAVAAGAIIGAYFSSGGAALPILLGIALAILGFYLLLRITLAFLLIALDQSEPIATSWRLLKGNVLRLVGLTLLIGLTILLIIIAGLIVTGLLGMILAMISPWLAGIAVVLMVLFGAFMWFVNWAVVSRALVLVYKGFTEGEAF